MLEDLDRAERMITAAVTGAAALPVEPIAHPGLQQLAACFVLSSVECQLVLLLLAVELQPGVGRQLDQLTGRGDGRPTVAALTAIVGERDATQALAPGAHLLASGLVELVGDGPFPARTVRLPDSVWPRIVDLPARLPFAVVPRGAGLGGLDLAPLTRAHAERAISRARVAPGRALIVVSGAADSGTRSLAVAIAEELGLAALIVPAATAELPSGLPHLRREAAWLGAALVLHDVPSADALARLAEVDAPIIVAAATPALDASAPRRWRHDIEIAELPLAERVACWRRHLGDVPIRPEVDVVGFAARFRFGADRIATVAAAAREHVRSGSGGVTNEALRQASRIGATRTGLAQRLESDSRLRDLVVPAATLRELELACAWARHGDAAFRSAAAGRLLRDQGGLVCLFHGPPGTGKTLAARAIAGELGADLLRIDLSQVINKYIGETEKNLARVFDEADAAGAILFFDEADALFGKRGETKDAQDRYANIEVAFLLQRLEVHPGIAILATNLRNNVDNAFSRRVQVLAEFPLPGADERRQIWERHLVREQLGADVDFAELGRRFTLAGGDIRNAAATALVLAAAAASPTVAMSHLVMGVWRELKKAGRVVSPDDFGPWRDDVRAFDRGAVALRTQ